MNPSIDAVRFLKDFRVPYIMTGNHLHRWLNIHCPFCAGSQDYHLGYNLTDGFWNCWRCGHKRWDRVSRALGGLPGAELRARYSAGEKGGKRLLAPLSAARRGNGRREAELPLGCGPLQARHRDYLTLRQLDATHLEPTWGILGTGVVGPDKLRVVAPVKRDGMNVTWQGRDITGRAKAKYRACPPEQEARPIKECLYGWDHADLERGVVVVEGVFDVWRLGPGAVATFGTAWSDPQAYALAEAERVFVFFDGAEEAAELHAEQLAERLKLLGVPAVERLDLNMGDPGDMTQTEADELMRELGLYIQRQGPL